MLTENVKMSLLNVLNLLIILYLELFAMINSIRADNSKRPFFWNNVVY